MTSKLGNPPYFESFGESCRRDFLERLIYLEEFMRKFF